MNKIFLFGITAEFSMQGITHLCKTYLICRNFYEKASYSPIFVLLVALCLRTNCNGEVSHQRLAFYRLYLRNFSRAHFFSFLASR